MISPPEYRDDPRLETLRRFFGRTGAPALHVVEDFLRAADDHALDWRLLPSICVVESSGGKAARHNNMFGWDSGRAEFTSLRAAIHTVAHRLTHSSLYKNKDLDGLLATYNPRPDYAAKVKNVMHLIAPAE